MHNINLCIYVWYNQSLVWGMLKLALMTYPKNGRGGNQLN